MRRNPIFIALLCSLLAGCVYRVYHYDAVGAFDDFDEVFVGKLVHMGQSATLEFVSEKKGIRCWGNSWMTFKPPGYSHVGIRGETFIECDDGRRVNGRYVIMEIGGREVGVGEGIDQNGNRLHFKFTSEENYFPRLLAEFRRQAVAKAELPPVYRPKETRKRIGFATGTGFFVSTEGHFITNYHVVEGARSVMIRTSNGAELPARVLVADPANDVVLAKVETESVPLRVTSGAGAKKGEEVLALGYPLIALQGQEQKATFGRINALSGFQGDVRFYQMDASIQPGNSGGPLLNTRGEVVGVVTATLPQIATLRATGTLPQNVNYAVKTDYMIPLLRAALGDQWRLPSWAGPQREMSEIVERAEGSVFLVIVR